MDRRIVRREFNKLGFAVLAQQIIFMTASILFLFLYLLVRYLLLPDSSEITYGQLLEEAFHSGSYMIAAAILGVLPMLLLKHPNAFQIGVRKKSRKISAEVLLIGFFAVMIFNLLTAYLNAGLEFLLNSIGYSLIAAQESATEASVTISMFLYSSIVAPVCEELVYRGAVMHYLERYGRFFAVFVSALLFGMMHGNIAQVPFAFAVGIVLGIVAQEYSVAASVLVHLLNNLHSDLIGWAELYIGKNISNIEFYIVLLISGIGLIVWAVIRRKIIREYIKRVRIKEDLLWCFMTSVGIILVLAYDIWQMVTSVSVLS